MLCGAMLIALAGATVAALVINSARKPGPPNQWARYRGIMKLRESAPPLVGYRHR